MPTTSSGEVLILGVLSRRGPRYARRLSPVLVVIPEVLRVLPADLRLELFSRLIDGLDRLPIRVGCFELDPGTPHLSAHLGLF